MRLFLLPSLTYHLKAIETDTAVFHKVRKGHSETPENLMSLYIGTPIILPSATTWDNRNQSKNFYLKTSINSYWKQTEYIW